MSTRTKPTLLLVPGAWHSPTHYAPLTEALTQAGYKCEAVALATVDPKDPAHTNADSDVEVIAAAIERLLAAGEDVVLVTHSYGGIPTQSAAWRFVDHDDHDDTPRAATATAARITGIAMMCAFLYPPHTSLIMPLGNAPAPFHQLDATGHLVEVSDSPGAEVLFYSDLPEANVARYKAMLRPHSWHSKAVPPSARGVGWWEIPTSYLVCERDNAIPVEFQRQMIREADGVLEGRQERRRIRVETVDSGHSPFLSVPQRAAEFVRRAAGEEIPIGA